MLRIRLHLVGIRLGYINLESNDFVPRSSAHKYPTEILGVSRVKPGWLNWKRECYLYAKPLLNRSLVAAKLFQSKHRDLGGD